MSGPTPGPWKRGRDWNPRVYGPDGTAYSGLLATVYAPGGDGETQGANARLMAAAPELLEALKGELAPSRSDCNERKCGACSRCRSYAAIAKAEDR